MSHAFTTKCLSWMFRRILNRKPIRWCLHVPMLQFSPLYTRVGGTSFRSGMPESSVQGWQTRVHDKCRCVQRRKTVGWQVTQINTCTADMLPSIWPGFRHPCRNDGFYVVYNDENSSLGTSTKAKFGCW